MSEYVKREDVYKTLKIVVNVDGCEPSTAEIDMDAFEAIPAANVEPVVRGELRINEQGFLECSACGKTLRMPLTSTYEIKRCYICGAHMERSGSGETD